MFNLSRISMISDSWRHHSLSFFNRTTTLGSFLLSINTVVNFLKILLRAVTSLRRAWVDPSIGMGDVVLCLLLQALKFVLQVAIPYRHGSSQLFGGIETDLNRIGEIAELFELCNRNRDDSCFRIYQRLQTHNLPQQQRPSHSHR